MNRYQKLWHRWILDSLAMDSPPFVIWFCLVFSLVFAVGFLCSHWIDQVDFAAYKPYSVFSDNIGGSTIDLMTNILPIDAVFTWVNGSDPVLLRSLRDLQEEKLFSCSYRHCFPSLYLVVHLEGPESEEALKGTYQSLTEVVRLTKGREERSVALIQMKSQGAFKALKEDIASLLGSNTSVFRAFWTSEVKVDLWAIERKIAAILKVTPNTDIKAELSNVAPGNYRKFFDSCSSVRHKDSYIVECPDESLLDLLKAAIEDYCKASNSKYPKIYPANLIYETSVTKEDYDINRFHDNEELRYSIRSIEKFAPWIRRLFLVTNGQIPYWLSLDHPKLTIVTHDQIFTNLSHLPTYSSPAIESHIHRIPGLSKHFLYLNDDVMFGSPVWPEDFFSKSTGYKVYLSWSLPECSSGCPGSWINDGFCDHPCNNSACDWDGDDCQRDGLEVPFDYFDRGDEGDSSLDSEYCAASCADTWLADSYCDSACNVMACGYDAGDCGEEIFRRNLFQINASNLKEDKMLVISDGAMAAWLDLNHLLKRWSNSTKVAGSSSRQKGLRVAALNKPSGFLVFVLRPNSSGTFDTRLDLGRGQTKSKVDEQVTFMVKFDTRERSSKQRLPKMNLTFTAENFNFSDKRSKIINLDLPKLYMNLSVDNVSLPVEVKRSLSHLSLQLQEDLLTQEGYLLKRAFILKSYFENEVSVSTNRPFVKRKLSSLDGRRTVGHFPWEKMGDDGGADLPPEGVLGRIGRRLLDRYAESLSFVNRLYNSEYGFHSRRVPAHIPHFIDRDIVEELQEKFSDEFDTTSSHKLRQGNDMQFALSYFYFLMSEKRIRSIGEIFREFDSDGSGTWSDREIRTFLVRTNDLPLTYSMILELHRELRNCSLKFETQPIPTTPYERYADSDLPTVSEELVTKCADSILAPRFKPSLRVARFFHTTTSDSEADFIMITSNLSTVIHHLDNVRKSAKKFLCFNSDLNPESKDNDLIRALLQDTYESLFPLPSSFELPANYRNRFLYTWEVAEWRRWRNLVRALIYASVSCLLLLTILTFCRSEIDRARRRWCRRFRNNKNIFGLAV